MGGRTRGAPACSRRVDMMNLHVVYHRGCQRPAGASAVGRASALLRGSPLVPIPLASGCMAWKLRAIPRTSRTFEWYV